MAGKKIRFEANNSAIREKIALPRANQIARITGDFKMEVINGVIWSITPKSISRFKLNHSNINDISE